MNRTDRGSDFSDYRNKYKKFIYKNYSAVKEDGFILLRFHFIIEGLSEFHPEIKIKTDTLDIVNLFNSEKAKQIIFSIGLVELISYWKCCCPPVIEIECGSLNAEEKVWWKKLWYNGLGEFFYLNSIETSMDGFVKIVSNNEMKFPDEKVLTFSDFCIVPIGGGKDSVVSLELLKKANKKIFGFTVNSQEARTQCAEAANIPPENMIKLYRNIDRNLLKLNSEGFLNGHTPFSAIVAFSGLYSAYLTGSEYIVLSNESSANEATIIGTDVNHQYSKSFEFEKDFQFFVRDILKLPVKYFSLLRPFNELQIAKQFTKYKKYLNIFKSCNKGSKQNIWCENCPKCLFVYIILSPFLSEEEMLKIFSENLLNKESLLVDFLELAGFSEQKPFECIGTVSEVRFAIEKAIEKRSDNLPFLLKEYINIKKEKEKGNPLTVFNKENGVPEEFYSLIEEMYSYVSADQ